MEENSLESWWSGNTDEINGVKVMVRKMCEVVKVKRK